MEETINNILKSNKKGDVNLTFLRDRIYICISLLGGQSDLLSIIGSWRDTLSDESIIEGLDNWIIETKVERGKKI